MGKLLRLPKDLKAIPQEEATTHKDDRKELFSTAIALLVMAILLGAIVSATTSTPPVDKVTAVAKEVRK